MQELDSLSFSPPAFYLALYIHCYVVFFFRGTLVVGGAGVVFDCLIYFYLEDMSQGPSR